MFLESFNLLFFKKLSLYTTKLFSLIVKNAFSVLDFYSFILLVLLFISFVFNFFSWGVGGLNGFCVLDF